MQGSVGSEVTQQIGQHDAENNRPGEEELFRIPARPTERQHLMLQTTQADLARQAVEDIKCKMCPNTQLSGWDDFQRHCDARNTRVPYFSAIDAGPILDARTPTAAI